MCVEIPDPKPGPKLCFEDVIESNYYSSGEDNDEE
jgi:hypothetical protein